MLCFTYWYNWINPLKFFFKTTILFLILPSVILWYIFFIYNDFLALIPIKYEILVGLVFTYFCTTLYIYFNAFEGLFKKFLDFLNNNKLKRFYKIFTN
jgi:hypothetical protein